MATVGKGKTSRLLIWVLLLLLIIGLAGFGIGGFGGSVRSVASVGDAEIDVNDYARGLQNELRAIQSRTGSAVSLSQAAQLGLDQAVLARLMTDAAFDHETARIGLSVGDEQVRSQVLQIPAFQSLSGNFDRAAYESTLRQSGLTVATFEDGIRKETARTLFQGALAGALPSPEAYAGILSAYLSETRDFRWIRLDQDDLAEPLPEPEEATLRAYHDENQDDFTRPEIKRITYAWLTPDMLLDTVSEDESVLRQIYQERLAEFVRPERRLVERLVFPDQATADDAKARLDAGEVSFDELVTERDLRLDDIDLGDVTEADLGDAGAAVFGLAEPGVAGPVATNLGPALFRMNAILAATARSFDDVRGLLNAEYAADRARRLIGDSLEEIEDLLAGGATLEELADETDMELGQIDWFPVLGDGIAGYNGFRNAALTLEEGDFPEVTELEDGGIFAMRLEEIVPPTLQPYDEVTEAVRNGWEASVTQERLLAQAEALAARLTEGATMDGLGLEVTTETEIGRDGFVQGAPEGFIERVFSLEPGGTSVIEGFGTALLIQLDAVNGTDLEDPDTASLRDAVARQARESVAQDVLALYARAVQAEAGISVNQAALNAVHAQFP